MAVAHCTEAIGQTDGYTILLTPDAIATSVELEPMNSEPASLSERRCARSSEEAGGPGGREQKVFGGLRNYACFEFVDSVAPN